VSPHLGKRIAIGLVAGPILLGLALALAWNWYASASQAPEFFESDIQAFEAQDRAAPTPPGAVVFYGSSSIRLWNSLAADMAPLRVVNRGFGGSQLSHLVHYVARAVTPLAPRAVVVYAGGNDLDARTGKTAERVIADYQALVRAIHADLPETRVYFLTIKPSKLRWERWPEMQKVNEAIAAWSAGDPRLGVIDVATPILGPDGKPRDEVFRLDGLHLNARGYAEWTRVVRPRLCADLGERC
jgi:lysophospholipase L1-like esterase